MKSLILIAVGLIVGVLVGYFFAQRFHDKELHAQALFSDLTSGKILMSTLLALDSGDTKKTRQIAMTSLHVTLSFLPTSAKKTSPTEEQAQQIVELAREGLGYMLLHRDEWDPRLPSVRMGVKGLGRILSDTNDLQRLAELTNHLAKLEASKQ